jgi:CPA2 family monovalent cation:H+ antiporter-2
VAVGLAQVGEFSFVLSELARHHGLMPEAGQNTLIAAAILSISLNPLLFRSLDKIERRLAASDWLWNAINVRAARRADRINGSAEPLPAAVTSDQQRLAIIVGYGPVGRAVDRLLREAGLATMIVELNADTVTELHSKNQAAVFGDASQAAILRQAGVDRASHLVVTLPQARQRTAVVAAARYLKPSLRILVRAHYLAERHELDQAGATAEVFEEGEAAVALARLVMTDAGADRERIDQSLRELRARLNL